jgi:hypothetical protein
MTASRRDFIRGFGVALASLLVTRCINLPGFSPVAPGTNTGSARDRLRRCWLAFEWFKARAKDDYERGNQARSNLLEAHQAALADLVGGGELTQPVAEQVQAAYQEAIDHLSPSPGNPGVTCYTVTPMEMVYMQSRSQLLKQADLLADSCGLDPDAVAQAQAALAREMTILSLPGSMLSEQLGSDAALPADFEVDISPEAAAAAEFLTRLLLRD